MGGFPYPNYKELRTVNLIELKVELKIKLKVELKSELKIKLKIELRTVNLIELIIIQLEKKISHKNMSPIISNF